MRRKRGPVVNRGRGGEPKLSHVRNREFGGSGRDPTVTDVDTRDGEGPPERSRVLTGCGTREDTRVYSRSPRSPTPNRGRTQEVGSEDPRFPGPPVEAHGQHGGTRDDIGSCSPTNTYPALVTPPLRTDDNGEGKDVSREDPRRRKSGLLMTPICKRTPDQDVGGDVRTTPRTLGKPSRS